MKNLIEEKKGKRLALVNANGKLIKAAAEGDRSLSADEQTQWEGRDSDIEKLNKEIRTLERQWEQEKDLASVDNASHKPLVNGQPQRVLNTPEYKDAFFNGFVRKGKNGMDPQHWNALEAGVDSEGGYLVPEEWASSVVRELAELVIMRKYAKVIQTASDRNIPIQTSRGAFTWIDEEGSYGTNDPAYNNVVLSAYKLGGIIQVSEELLQDNAFNLEGELRVDAAEEFADKEEDAFIDGDGTLKPEGIFDVATVGGVSVTGFTGAVSASPAITYDDLVETQHALARKYRRNAIWVMSDGHVKLIRQLTDSQNRPLWQPSVIAGAADTLLGDTLEVSDSCPAPTVATRGIVYGDLGYYTIVDRLGMTAQRLNELYAANGQVGFKFMKRVDGNLTQAKAITFFAHGAAS